MEFRWWLEDYECDALLEVGQYFASGFLRGNHTPLYMRHANGVRSQLCYAPLSPYSGESIYPAVPSLPWQEAMMNHYVTVYLHPECAEKLAADAETEVKKSALKKLADICREIPNGAHGYTHSIVNYGRILQEGLYAYVARIKLRLEEETDQAKIELLESLLVVADSIDCHRLRVIDHLDSMHFDDSEKENNRLSILSMLKTGLPMRPANSFREALLATSFIFHIDGCDNLGRFDQFMWRYYAEDTAAGRLERSEAVEMVRELWRLLDLANGWNVALGGTTPEGKSAANELTAVCMEAGKGMRRPNLALRLREDTPDYIWDAALDCIQGGTGIPALYSEENYLKAIDAAQLNLPDSDKYNYAFGGCTELMVHGCSNVGSLDDYFSIIQILDNVVHRSLLTTDSFDELLDRFKQKVREEVYSMTGAINKRQELRSKYYPQLIRTLLIDDCIDRARNYYDGGARHNWSVVSVHGLSNAVDSLIALKHAVFEDKHVSAHEMLEALSRNFEGKKELHAYLKSLPKYGNDDEEVNALAADLSAFVYQEFKRYAPWRGGKFMCGTIMFTTYADFGAPIGATPDGREAGAPVADSAGPVQGRDKNGPTAMLRSVSSLSQKDAPGTLVVNIRLDAAMFTNTEGRNKIKALIKSYFALGGMQLQVNVVDQKVLLEAFENPEKYSDLVIRMGGYSEYWGNLTKELRLSILERTEHALR